MVLKILESPLLPRLRPRLRGLRTGILAGSTIPVTLVRALGSELGLHGITIGWVEASSMCVWWVVCLHEYSALVSLDMA